MYFRVKQTNYNFIMIYDRILFVNVDNLLLFSACYLCKIYGSGDRALFICHNLAYRLLLTISLRKSFFLCNLIFPTI